MCGMLHPHPRTPWGMVVGYRLGDDTPCNEGGVRTACFGACGTFRERCGDGATGHFMLHGHWTVVFGRFEGTFY